MASPCPITSAFPAGTYQLETRYTQNRLDQSSSLGNVCTYASGTGTASLTIGVIQGPTYQLTFGMDLIPFGPAYYFTSDFSPQAGSVVHFQSTCGNITCPPDSDSIQFDFDITTGIITNLAYALAHTIGPVTPLSLSVSASGWPVCAATYRTASSCAPPRHHALSWMLHSTLSTG